jgi:hypothetical protein
MDTTNPRWETREERRDRSATMWKIIVGAAGASALTAVIVASCLDRGQARRDAAEPAYVETTAVMVPAPAQGNPASITDGTACAVDNGRAADGTTGTTGATIIVPPTINNTTNILPDGTTSSSITTSGPRSRVSAPAATQIYTPNPPPLSAAVTTNGSTDANDPNNRNAPQSSVAGTFAPNPAPTTSPTNGTDPPAIPQGSNPDAPSFSAGAGPFDTEAPYWSSSAWKSDPNAGAGPFTTERNTPAR